MPSARKIVVVDTGSSDRTREIAKSLGAKLGEFPWVDDFAAARNAALNLATGDYAFWLDADDRLDAEERQLADLRAQGVAWADIAAQLGGTPDGRRVQLNRAVARVSSALGLVEDDETGD